MATPSIDHIAEEVLQGGFPCRRVRLHHYSHLPVRPDRIHGLLQRPKAKRQGATTDLEHRRGRQALPVLQQGCTSCKFCVAELCEEGAAVTRDRAEDSRREMLLTSIR